MSKEFDYEGTELEIAVIGMAGKFPQAKDINEFWKNITNGVESISFFSKDELKKQGIEDELLENPNYIRAMGVLEDKELFDGAFFGYTPRDIEIMDPQIRVFHEVAWSALENAGYPPSSYKGLIGVYAGGGDNQPWEVVSLTDTSNQMGPWAIDKFSNINYLSTRIAYSFNLKGPCVTINTACSTSLVAIHLACQSLLSGECDIGLAGGVEFGCEKKKGYLYQEGMIFSPDGHCRAFDAKAAGTVGGEGAAVVVLKPLRKALKDGDHIYAIVKGSAINNDGNLKVGFTSPAVKGQRDVIKAAQLVADVESESITYIETHGTGTSLGDSVEISALKQIFNTDKKGYCAISSVKTNVGHLGIAAGVTGFIKAALALKSELIPSGINFETPNPTLEIEDSPFYINTSLKKWERGQSPLRAAVSSFGIGGTNAHIILEEPPHTQPSEKGREYNLVTLSAKTKTALEQKSVDLFNYLQTNPELNLQDVVYTLHLGREDYRYRKMFVASTLEESLEILGHSSENVKKFIASEKKSKVVFMFPGQGAQYVNMGLDLYRTEPSFKQEVDSCFDVLRSITPFNFKEVLYPLFDDTEVQEQIKQTHISQPLIFVFEYALAKLLISWGIKPDAMIGHSLGEYVAATISNVFTLETALQLVVVRAQLMQSLPIGSMISVALSEQELQPLLNNDLSIAAVNSSNLCTVSGTKDEIEHLTVRLVQLNYKYTEVQTSHAFHSSMMDPILDSFREVVSNIQMNTPEIPLISNLTGNWILNREVKNPEYWVRHIREKVHFSNGLNTLLDDNRHIFIEVGPGQTLLTFLKQHQKLQPEHKMINLVRCSNEELADDYYLINKLGQLWLYNVQVKWEKYYAGQKRARLPLPTYPFERTRFNIKVDFSKKLADTLFAPENSRKNISEWYYTPVWKQSLAVAEVTDGHLAKYNWLVFKNDHPCVTELIAELQSRTRNVITVESGDEFDRITDAKYIINPAQGKDYEKLFLQLQKNGKLVDKIVHLWNLTNDENKSDLSSSYQQTQDLGLYSLTYIAQALGKLEIEADIDIEVVSNNLHSVLGTERIFPEKATLLGPIKIIPVENLNLHCRSIDVLPDFRNKKLVTNNVLSEFLINSKDNVVAYRGNHRWIQSFESVKLEECEEMEMFKEKGVYLILGGFGGMGLTIAEFLSKNYQGTLILVGRSEFPTRGRWDKWLTEHASDDPTSLKIRKIREMESSGAEVLIIQSDIASLEDTQQFIRAIKERYPKLNALIHSAGVIDLGGVIQRRNREITEKYMAPKVQGILNLEKALKSEELYVDILLLFSSIGNVLYKEKFGQISYNASNEFVEAYATFQNTIGGLPTKVINWCDWIEVGMSVDAQRIKEAVTKTKIQYQSLIHGDISPTEGVEVFKRFVHNPFSHLTVFPYDLNEIIGLQNSIQVELNTFEEVTKRVDSETVYFRPELSTEYVSPTNRLEKNLCEIFQRFFGLEKIGIYDDFFELGGDSLKAMSVISSIHKAFKVKLSFQVFISNPTIAELAGYIRENTAEDEYEIIPLATNKSYYPLSSAQKRMYILQQMTLGKTIYNNTIVKVMEEEITLVDLEKTFTKLIQRHESLRTSFELVDNIPVQKIFAKVNFTVQSYSMTKDENFDKIVNQFVKPFDLSKAPLFRLAVLRRKDVEDLLMIDIHHIISDHLSLDIIFADFVALYQGKELKPLPLQYKDYSEWQNSQKQRKCVQDMEEYWLRQFVEKPEVLNLPLDFERPLSQSFAGNVINFEFDSTVTERLNRFTKGQGTTNFNVLLAVYNIFLYKLTNQEDIVVGCPVSGRYRSDFENIVGLFINTLAMRNHPTGDLTFQEFLHKVKANTIEAFNYQEYQFEELVEKVSPVRDTSRNPLFEVMFNYLEQKRYSKEVHKDIAIQNELGKCQITSKFDLFLQARETDQQIFFDLEYCTDLFKVQSVFRFIDYFKNILNAVIQNPEQKLADLEIIAVNEKRQILKDFNNTVREYPENKLIQQIFTEKAAKNPEKIALVYHDKELTYGELNDKANRLATTLISKGVKPNNLVAIMVERSFDMIIGILGVLKAGAGYLPIDPEDPIERIKFILQDSKVEILLTHFMNNQDSIYTGLTLELDDPKTYEQEVDNYHVVQSPDNLAYIIYTSGSTGHPKGVAVEQKNVLNTLHYMEDKYPVQAGDAYLLKTTFAFDVSVTELFGWFLGDGKLVILEKEGSKDPKAIVEMICLFGVTHINFVPSMLDVFLDVLTEENVEVLEKVKFVFVAGEALPPRLVNRFYGLLTKPKLENLYGPTEASIYATGYSLYSGIDYRKIFIGKPIANTSIYILDAKQKIVPIGVVGEMYISGDGIAREYLNRLELNKEKFITNPYTAEKMYRTGDMARWRDDGNIEFLGRVDNQVKVRGYRIELEEIENQLFTFEGVKDTIVMVFKDSHEDNYVCAYVVLEKELDQAGFKLREYLSGKLPNYMLPAQFIFIEAIPTLPNGKVDRKKLPHPDQELQNKATTYVPSRNDIEAKLVEVWENVLDRSNIGIHNNFFMLGGDSIKAIQIVSRMAKEGYSIKMSDIFQNTSIIQLATQVQFIETVADQSTITGNIPLTPIQKEFFLEDNCHKDHYNQSILLYSKEGLGEAAIRRIIAKIQETHDALRIVFTDEQGEIVQINKDLDYPVDLQVYDLLGCADEFQKLHQRANEVQESIQLNQGPLMKLALFHMSDGDRLLIVSHHLVIDGISWRIILEDINTLYNQIQEDRELTLPLKTTSFQRWAQFLREYANTDLLVEKSYWKQIESIEVSSIPTDYTAKNLVKDIAYVSFELTQKDTKDLLTKVHYPFGTAINDILITALGLSIKYIFGTDNLLIAVEGHGREDIRKNLDTVRTVGWFTTVYPIIIQLTHVGDLSYVIRNTKETIHRVPNKGIGYGLLKYLTEQEYKQDISFQLRPQIVFNYLGQFDSDANNGTFEIINGSIGSEVSPDRKRQFELELTGLITNHQLKISLYYSTKQYKSGTINRLLSSYQTNLQNIINYCLSLENKVLTPTDLTYKNLSIEELANLTERIPGEIQDICQLTPMQEGMLFDTLYSQTNTLYLNQIAYRFKDVLELAIVQQSVEVLLQRHDILRTIFIYDKIERPLQVILKECNLDFTYEDISDIEDSFSKEKHLEFIKQEDRQNSFDLNTDTLIRIKVVQLKDTEYEFIWTFHHILMDGWCLGILISEFIELYNSFLKGQPSVLPDTRPYRSYIEWLNKQDMVAAKEFWKDYLAGCSSPVNITSKSKASGGSEYIICKLIVQLSEAKTQELQKMSVTYKVTLNTILQSIWGVVLSKYNNTNDVIFGVVVSGRNPEIVGVESMVGLFINTIPFRIQYDPQTKFSQLIKDVQQKMIYCEKYSFFPLAEIQAAISTQQNLLTHVLAVENYPTPEKIEELVNTCNKTEMSLHKISDIEFSEHDIYDFVIMIGLEKEMKITLQYNSNVYEHITIEKIKSDFEHVIDYILENENMLLKDIRLDHNLMTIKTDIVEELGGDFNF